MNGEVAGNRAADHGEARVAGAEENSRASRGGTSSGQQPKDLRI